MKLETSVEQEEGKIRAKKEKNWVCRDQPIGCDGFQMR